MSKHNGIGFALAMRWQMVRWQMVRYDYSARLVDYLTFRQKDRRPRTGQNGVQLLFRGLLSLDCFI